MAHDIPQAHRANPVQTGLLAIACLTSLALCGWLFVQPHATSPTPSPAGPAATEALALLAPLVPPGSLRIAVRPLETGRDILILQDAATPALDIALVQRLLTASIGYDAQAGDTLTLERAAFAAHPGSAGRLPAILAGLNGLLLAGMLLTRHARTESPASRHRPEERPAAPLTAAAPAAVEAAATLAERRPDAAIQVLRRWMREGETA